MKLKTVWFLDIQKETSQHSNRWKHMHPYFLNFQGPNDRNLSNTVIFTKSVQTAMCVLKQLLVN